MIDTDKFRVLIDFDDDGVFSLTPGTVQGELRNIIADPLRMNTAQHSAINGAWLHRTNWLPYADRLDAYEYHQSTATAPILAHYRDGNLDSRYVLRINNRNAVVSPFFDIGRTTGSGSEGRLPQSSDGVVAIATPAAIDLPAGNWTLRVRARATADTVGETFRISLNNSGGSTVGGGASFDTVMTEDWQTIEADFVLAGPETDMFLTVKFQTATDASETFEITDLGIYQQAEVDFTSQVEYISQDHRQQDVYPIIKDNAADDNSLGQFYAHVHAGTDVFGGYRCVWTINSLPTLQAEHTYTALVWVRHTGAVTTAVDLVARVGYAQADKALSVLERVSVPVTLGSATEWQRLYLTFITPADISVMDIVLEVVKNNDATAREFQVSGWMLVDHTETAENLLTQDPDEPNQWNWNTKFTDFGPQVDSLGLDFADTALKIISRFDFDEQVLYPSGVDAPTWASDTMGGVLYNTLNTDTFYRVELVQYVVSPSEFATAPTELRAVISPTNGLGTVYASSFRLWHRQQLVFNTFSDTDMSLELDDAVGIGSLVSLPRLYEITYRNKFPFGHTNVTVTPAGAATGVRAAGSNGPYFQVTMNASGGDSVMVGAVGEIALTDTGEHLLHFDFASASAFPYTATCDIVDQAGATIKTITLGDYALEDNDNYYRVVTDFNPDPGVTSIRLRFNAPMTVTIVKNIWVLSIADFDVVSNVPTEWNSGQAEQGLDNISDYVIGVRSTSGKNKFDAEVAFEGSLDITLNNNSRYFSQANTASPYFGLLRENLKVQLQVRQGVDWHVLWTGWTHKFDVAAGTSRSKQAEITCRQGVFRLHEGEFIPGIYEDVSIDTLLPDLIALSGWYSMVSALSGYLDRARLAVDAVLFNEGELFDEKDPGVYPFEFVGDGWNRETTLIDAMKDLLQAESAQLWLTREGQFVLRNRDFFINRAENADYTVDLADVPVTNAEYVYGQEVVNRVEVKLTPKEVIEDAIIWQSQAPFEIPASKKDATTTRTFELDFRFEEGAPRTIKKVYSLAEGSTMTADRIKIGRRTNVFKAMAANDVEKNLKMTINDVADGGKTVTIESKFRETVYVSITLRGDYIKSGEAETYVFEDEQAIKDQKAVYKQVIDAKAITREDEAETLAQFILLRKSRPFGEFSRIDITEDIATTLNWKVGTVLLISEPQTMEVNLPHIILQENFDIEGNVLKVSYTLARLDSREYAAITADASSGRLIYL